LPVFQTLKWPEAILSPRLLRALCALCVKKPPKVLDKSVSYGILIFVGKYAQLL